MQRSLYMVTKKSKRPFLKKIFYLFISRERGREGEKHQCVAASHMAPTEGPARAQACALTGNRTSDPLVHSQCSIH